MYRERQSLRPTQPCFDDCSDTLTTLGKSETDMLTRSFWGGLLSRLHAAKAEMVGAGVDFAFAARADDVTRAVLVVAQKRASAMDALFLVRLGWIKW